jgi:Zn-dependent protease with chaperone function
VAPVTSGAADVARPDTRRDGPDDSGRETVTVATNWLRLVLTIALLAGTPAVALVVAAIDLALVCAFVLLALAALVWHHSSQPMAELALSAAATATFIAATCLIAIGKKLLASRRAGEKSILLPDKDTGPLRAMIDDIARKAGTAAPTELRLTAAAEARVTERSRLLGSRDGTRSLYLGLPLLVGLSRSQLEAVLSHEIGHYAGGHARSIALARRSLDSLEQICQLLKVVVTTTDDRQSAPKALRPYTATVSAIPLGFFALNYRIFVWYKRRCFYIRRCQEFDADKTAEQIAGGAGLADALRRCHALSTAWKDFQDQFLWPMHAARCSPGDPFGAFRQMLNDSRYRDVLRNKEQKILEQPTSPDDSHPCLRDRLARLSHSPARPGSQPDSRPAITILPTLQDRQWIADLRETMQPPGRHLEVLPWDDCINRVVQPREAALADGPLRAASAISPAGRDASEPPALASVLDLIEHRRNDLATALAGSKAVPDSGSSSQLSDGLFALTGFTMVATGRARWEIAWTDSLETGDPRLVANDIADTATGQIRDRVISFASDTLSLSHVSSIRIHLINLGIDLGSPVQLTPIQLTGPSASRGAEAGTTMVVTPAYDPREVGRRQIFWLIGVVIAVVTAVLSFAAGQGQVQYPVPPPPAFTPIPALPDFTPPPPLPVFTPIPYATPVTP